MDNSKATNKADNLKQAREFFENNPDHNFILLTEKDGNITRISSMGGNPVALVLDLAIATAIQPATLEKLANAVKVNINK